MNNQIEQAIKFFKESKRAVALTGAGISTPSGIPDFRSPSSGLWNKYDPMVVASIDGFKRRPEEFYRWIHPLADLILHAEPNPAHMALAELETHGPLKAIITQNIDLLHHRAGSSNVYEVHGHLRQATCLSCGYITGAERMLADFVATAEMPRCELCGDVLKPNVTLYGEVPPLNVFQAAEGWAATCDLMLVAGSSLQVMPVAELPLLARQNGSRLIIVDLLETYLDEMADLVIRGDVAEVLPQLSSSFVPQ
ncbi:MAG: NAD-dependent deacylase [Anaerolineaceae bacterium]|nr:MAG: NAD-dependent deacylase [Anaerolineaceae bacterium]